MTALHIAAAWGRMNIVKLLLNYGADSYLIDEDYKTAIDYAEENGYFEIVEYISYNQQSPSVQRYTYELGM